MSNHDLPGTKSDSSSQEGGPAASAGQAKEPLYMGGFRNLPVQRKLNVGSVDDPMEKEADVMADKVMRMPAGPERKPGSSDQEEELRRKPFVPGGSMGGDGAVNDAGGSAVKDAGGDAGSGGKGGLTVPAPLARGIESARGSGEALPGDTRDFMGARFGADFSGVRIHTGEEAAKFSGALNAKAFTLGKDIFFNRGDYSPDTAEGRHLLAHELTHTIQQGTHAQGESAQAGVGLDRAGVGTDGGGAQQLRRKVELKPPGKGQATAFDRAQDIIDRLNRQSAAIQYKLNGNELEYTIVDETSLSFFDRQMRQFIDEDQQVPVRLITGQGRSRFNERSPFVPVLIDEFASGYVDVDDLMATDEQSFQNWFIHFLTERFHVKNYAHLLGTPDINAVFRGAHKAAIQAEAQRLQDVLNDPTIEFVFEEIRPATRIAERGFRSKAEKYYVFLVTHNIGRDVSPTEMFVRKTDGKRVSIEEFRKERDAAAAAKAPPVVPATGI